MIESGTAYRITKGNDSLSVGDIVALSPRNGDLLVCPVSSTAKTEQGGWYDKEDLENYPEILDFEAELAENEYEFFTGSRGEEGIRRK